MSAIKQSHDSSPSVTKLRAEHNSTSFVSLNELKDHLVVLAAFSKVHLTVQPGGILVDDQSGLPVSTPASYLFLSRAQYRFDLWISRVLKNDSRETLSALASDEIPPLDVLMFLHAYMLSPWNFYEDCYRVYPELSKLRYPFSTVRSMIDVNTMAFVPAAGVKAFWESKTGTAFDIPFTTEATETVQLTCPKCSSVLVVPWINEFGTGFGQIRFSTHCGKCELTISQEALAFARFITDLSDPKFLLAHSLLNELGEIDVAGAKTYMNAIRDALGNPTMGDGDKYHWKISSVVSSIPTHAVDVTSRINYIVKAYIKPSQPSMDLGSAVLRQACTILEMNKIGVRVFEGDEEILLAALVRYYQWLHLDAGALVPVPDIDLVFHTHQLHGTDFRKDSIMIVGRFLSHDDSSDSSVISRRLDDTQKKWLAKYGSVYMIGTDLCAAGCDNQPPSIYASTTEICAAGCDTSSPLMT